MCVALDFRRIFYFLFRLANFPIKCSLDRKIKNLKLKTSV